MQPLDLRGAVITRVTVDGQSDVHIQAKTTEQDVYIILSTAQVIDILGQYRQRGFTLNHARRYLSNLNQRGRK